MHLKEIYKFPEGSNIGIRYIPHWLCDKPYFPCPENMNYACAYFRGVYIPPLDTSNVRDMSYMFNYCPNLISIDLTNWDTSNVRNMSSMFNYCTKLTQLDLTNWDTSNVTNMSYMFSYCRKLTQLDLTNWDTSNVTNMSNMFQGCEVITTLDLTNWDTSNVKDMGNMFDTCKALTSLSSIRADSLSIPSYSSPFGTSNNTTLVDFGGFINLKSSWNGSYCVDKLTALSHQSLVNILNGLYDFTGNGETPTSSQGKIKFGSTHLANLSDEEKAIATNKGWVLS